MTPLCPQYDLLFSAFRGQEDCLFLNIFTPIVKRNKLFKKYFTVLSLSLKVVQVLSNFIVFQHPASPQKNGSLPVMVFLHGGRQMFYLYVFIRVAYILYKFFIRFKGLFMFGGSGEFYGGRYFMDEPVIFISLNYRVGLLGRFFR